MASSDGLVVNDEPPPPTSPPNRPPPDDDEEEDVPLLPQVAQGREGDQMIR